LDITGRGPMVVETCRRLSALARDEELTLVIAQEHEEETLRLFAGRKVNIVSEPVGRNTAACIGLGALYAAGIGAKGPVAFLPADHFILDTEAFLQTLHQAATSAESGAIVTIGIVPNRPETGYGYIHRAQGNMAAGGAAAYRVAAFVEKPDLQTAIQYLEQGDYYWNAGIFVATPDTILTEIKKHLPALYQGLQQLESKIGAADFAGALASVYGQLESVSFDYGIMEKTGNPLLVVPCECGWSDVGSWASLYDLRKAEQDGCGNLAEGDALLVDCEGSYVSSRGGKLVACLGLKHCLIVDTPDALLVADLERSQEVRKITEGLHKAGHGELL
ncbi:MAG: sugar phosphate nucleotidyltransferase, partial [Deltaproteobacteria bacterium]